MESVGKIEKLIFSSEAQWLKARRRDVTASTVAALFGIHEFTTPYALWAEKSGKKRSENVLNDAIMRGKLLEPVAVSLLQHDFPDWEVIHNSGDEVLYLRDPEYRIGATPDTFVNCPLRGKGTVQIKSVEASIYRKKWCANGEPEPPLWIALQAAIEAHMTDSDWAAVAPIVVSHGIEVPLIEIPLSKKVVASVYAKAKEFWTMIGRGEEPDPDFSLDSSTIDALHSGDGSEIDLSRDLSIYEILKEYAVVSETFASAQARLEEIKTELKHSMQGSEYAYLPNGLRMSWKRQRRRFPDGTTRVTRVLRVPKISEEAVSSGASARPDEAKELPEPVYDKWKF